MKPNLDLTIKDPDQTKKYQVIVFNGEFDKAGHAEVKTKIESLVKNFQLQDLIFDFTSLKFINSEGIGYLIEIHTHLGKLGKKLIIVGPAEQIRDVFTAIGIMSILPVYKDLEEYLKTI